LPVGLVLRSVGYRGVALPEVPFDEKRSVIPNRLGRVTVSVGGAVVPGEYVAGWIKRGPTGVIGTNKADAAESVRCLLEDAPQLARVADADVLPEAIERFLEAKGVRFFPVRPLARVRRARTRGGQSAGPSPC
jgi:ferredoxin--NADP+ reductase